MVDTGLSVLVPAVEIVIEDMAVEHAPEPDADSVGNIEKLVPADVCQGAECAEYSCPLADFHRVGLEDCFSADLADFECHEGVDVLVDIGQVHEGCCVEQGDYAAIGIFFELWSADGPESLVFCF